MITTAFVNIWGVTAGAVAWDEKSQSASFEYDENFLRSGWDLAPLKMPLSEGRKIFNFPELSRRPNEIYNAFNGLPGLLADVLPDRYGNQLINVWLARQGRPPEDMNPVEKLCFIGTRGMGALEFKPAYFSEKKKTFKIEIDELVNIAQAMLSERKNFKTDLTADEKQAMTEILKIGTSAGGARPKAVIAYNEATGEVRSGQTEAPKGFEQWLIKLDGVSDVQLGESKGYGRVEMAYYLMAKSSGIEMMPSRLIEENGRAHFMTRRFDRDEGNMKHHIQTLCALKHMDFNDVMSFSYEQLFQTMRELKLSYPSAEQMFRRMVFNVLARNCDDHTKNFSFRLKKGGAWELAPAYDVCHAYRPGSQWVSQQSLSVNGKRTGIGREDFLAVAASMNIKKARVIIDEINEAVSRWSEFSKETGVDKKLSEAISKTIITL